MANKKMCTKHIVQLCRENKIEVKKIMSKHERQSSISDGVNWVIQEYIELKKRLGIQ